MLKEAFDYQTQLVGETAVAVKKHNWVVAQAPTGSGKSHMMSMIVQRGLGKGVTFLVLTESKSIFRQLVNEFGARMINAKTNYFVMQPGNVYVAMSQSLANRPKIIQQFLDLGDKMILMIDEAHVGTTKNVIQLFPGRRIGFTATPAYRWAKHLKDLYNEIVVGPQVLDLIHKGRLSSYRHIGRDKIDESVLEKGSNGEITESSNEKAFGTSKVYDGLYEDLRNLHYKCGIIYVASIKQCEEVYAKLIEHGFNCAINHSKVSKLHPDTNCDEQNEKFENDPECLLMVTVGTLTKGYDNPIIDLVALHRATTSLPLYLQMCGRGGRVLNKPEDIQRYLNKVGSSPDFKPTGKSHFICLDNGGNKKRFGCWDSDRDWRDLWLESKPKQAPEAAPVKECPKCQSYIATSASVCKWCGYEYPESEMVYEMGELVDFNEAYTAIIGKRLSELTAEELAEYAKNKNRSLEAIRIATARRQRERWQYLWAVKNEFLNDPWKDRNFLRDFGAAMGYKPNWYTTKTGEIVRLEKAAKQEAEALGIEFDLLSTEIKFRDVVLR